MARDGWDMWNTCEIRRLLSEKLQNSVKKADNYIWKKSVKSLTLKWCVCDSTLAKMWMS